MDTGTTTYNPEVRQTKFAVGDLVKCIGEESSAGGGWELGLQFIVERISNIEEDNPIYWRGKRNNGVYENHLRLVTNEIKIGSKIKLKKYTGYSDYEQHEGQEAAIVEKVNDPNFDYQIQWSDGSTSRAKVDNMLFGMKFDKSIKKLKPFAIGDIITCNTSFPDSFSGEGQVIYNDEMYYHIKRLDNTSGSGILLENGYKCWRVGIGWRRNLKRVNYHKIEIEVNKKIRRIFKIKDEVFIKDRGIVGLIDNINYHEGFPSYTIKSYSNNKHIVVESSNIKKTTVKIKAEVCYQCMIKKLSRDRLGTPEENEKIKPGCVIQTRNLEICENNGNEIGRKYIVLNSKYNNSSYCVFSKDSLKSVGTYPKEQFKFVEDLSNKFTFKISSLVIKTFNQYKGEKSPILLLGKNKKGVVDVVLTATDESGCDDLAGMSPEVFASTLRNIMLTKRIWVGYGIIYYGDRPQHFSPLGLEFIEMDENFNRFYICILPGKGVYPYKLIKYDGRIQLLPVQIEIVN